jgi:hypothetical protein
MYGVVEVRRAGNGFCEKKIFVIILHWPRILVFLTVRSTVIVCHSCILVHPCSFVLVQRSRRTVNEPGGRYEIRETMF